jgi:hypothetical protein
MFKCKTDIWYFLDAAKRRAVSTGFTRAQLTDLWQECNDLFRQATGSPVCPGLVDWGLAMNIKETPATKFWDCKKKLIELFGPEATDCVEISLPRRIPPTLVVGLGGAVRK